MVKGIFTAFLLFNVFHHITPHNTKRALRVTSYLVECAVATEPRSGWRGGLWSGLNRTKLERGALLVIRGLGGTKNTQGGMRSRLQLTYNSVCNLSEDKSFVMKSIYLISISTEHFISTDRTQGGKSRCKDLCSDIDVQFKRNRTKHSLYRSEKIL